MLPCRLWPHPLQDLPPCGCLPRAQARPPATASGTVVPDVGPASVKASGVVVDPLLIHRAAAAAEALDPFADASSGTGSGSADIDQPRFLVPRNANGEVDPAELQLARTWRRHTGLRFGTG